MMGWRFSRENFSPDEIECISPPFKGYLMILTKSSRGKCVVVIPLHSLVTGDNPLPIWWLAWVKRKRICDKCELCVQNANHWYIILLLEKNLNIVCRHKPTYATTYIIPRWNIVISMVIDYRSINQFEFIFDILLRNNNLNIIFFS